MRPRPSSAPAERRLCTIGGYDKGPASRSARESARERGLTRERRRPGAAGPHQEQPRGTHPRLRRRPPSGRPGPVRSRSDAAASAPDGRAGLASLGRSSRSRFGARGALPRRPAPGPAARAPSLPIPCNHPGDAPHPHEATIRRDFAARLAQRWRGSPRSASTSAALSSRISARSRAPILVRFGVEASTKARFGQPHAWLSRIRSHTITAPQARHCAATITGRPPRFCAV